MYNRYICGWFFIDLITSLPIEFMFGGNDVTITLRAFRAVRIARMVKLLRFFKMLRLLSGILRTLLSRHLTMFVRLCRFLFVMMLFAHFGACAWYATGSFCYSSNLYDTSWIETAGIAGDSTSKWQKYSTAWYFSVVTLMTTGYGDISATNILEQWVASIFILIGTCFFAYFIGAVGSLLAEGDRVRAERNEKVEQAQQFCAAKKLPKDLAHAIVTHTKYHCKHNFLFDEMMVLENLPSYLRYVINLDILGITVQLLFAVCALPDLDHLSIVCVVSRMLFG